MVRWGSACLVAAAMAGCGGGGGSTPAPVIPSSAAIASASALAANDTAVNNAASFKVLQDAGIPAVSVPSISISARLAKVNFTVFSDGVVKTGLTTDNVSVAIAQLVPGTNGNPDQWNNYTNKNNVAATRDAGVYTAAVTATLVTPKIGTPTIAQQKKPYTDPALPSQLVYNSDGYYTYTFSTEITNTAQTNGVVYDGNLTHRVAIQLNYKNAAGETINVNPYFDFTVVNGNAVAVTDPLKTRKMADVASCNGCHQKLAMHGDSSVAAAVDTQTCVMCHNAGNTDLNSGNVLTLATMVHKIHSGKLLQSKLAAGGENYTVGTTDFSTVGFPQDLRNCAVCHSGANPKTPQGDNWKTKPSKEACLTCHVSTIGFAWEIRHKVYTPIFEPGSTAALALTNKDCANCHAAGSATSAENVHWNQSKENAANYKMNIIGTPVFNDTPNHLGRTVTVQYFLSNPSNLNAAYNLVTPDCTGTALAPVCAGTSKFGNLRFYLGYQNMVGQATDKVTEFTAYGNSGNNGTDGNAYAYAGLNDGSNHYTLKINVPNDTPTAVIKGTARVISTGQVIEDKVSVSAGINTHPVVTPKTPINVVIQNTSTEIVISGSLLPRRTVVATEKCNVCHGILGSTSGSNTLPEAFHNGANSSVETCAVCHDVNTTSATKTFTTNGAVSQGIVFNTSLQLKRVIHAAHSTQNNCSACHVNDSYKTDMGTLGTVIQKSTLLTDPSQWSVISPKASSCTACHTGVTTNNVPVSDHVTWFGGATFGDKTQVAIAGLQPETCNDCHASGAKNVATVHGQK